MITAYNILMKKEDTFTSRDQNKTERWIVGGKIRDPYFSELDHLLRMALKFLKES